MSLRCDLQVIRVRKYFVFVRDLNLGNRSLTNDADAVAKHLHRLYPDRRQIYRDSMDEWSEIVHRDGRLLNIIPYHGPTPWD